MLGARAVLPVSEYCSMEIEVEGIKNAGLIFYSRARKELSLCACSGLYQGDIASMEAAADVQLAAQ